MKIERIAGIAALAAVLLMAGSSAVPLYADTASIASTGGASPRVSMVGQAWMNYTGPAPTLLATYTDQSSNQTAPMNATAIATVHNVIGQTIAIESVSIIGLSDGQNATIGFALNLPYDAYTVNLFVVDASGAAVSANTNSTVIA